MFICGASIRRSPTLRTLLRQRRRSVLHEPAVVSGWPQGEDHLGSCQGDCRQHAAHSDRGVRIRVAAVRLVGVVLQGSVSTDDDGTTRVTAGQHDRD